MLNEAGHCSDARSMWHNLVGRDVLEGRWTFQVVEGFDNDYYEAARAEVHRLVEDLAAGRRHVHEEAMRRRPERTAFFDPDACLPRFKWFVIA